MEVDGLREKLGSYETVSETMHCGLLAEDTSGIIVFANERLLSWLGYTREEVVGQLVEMLAPRELRELIREDVLGAEAGDLRARLLAIQRKDSTTFPVVTLPQRLLDASGNYEGYFSIVVDLGAVMTARSIGSGRTQDLRSRLHRIALELESISLATQSPSGAAVPLNHPELQGISPREAQVLALLVAGSRVTTVAQQLHISPHTVRNHLKSMFRKLGVGSQTELLQRVHALMDSEEAPTPRA